MGKRGPKIKFHDKLHEGARRRNKKAYYKERKRYAKRGKGSKPKIQTRPVKHRVTYPPFKVWKELNHEAT